jgi:flagellin
LGVVGATTGTSSSELANVVTSGALAAGDLAIQGFAISASSNDGVSYVNASSSAIAKANAINASSSLTGVTASVGSTTYTNSSAIAATGAVSAGDLLINGVDIGALSAAADGPGRANQLVAAINAKAAQTGVTAAIAANETAKLTLTATDGRNITTNVKSSAAAAGGSLENFAVANSNTSYAKITLASSTTSSIKIGGSSGGVEKIGTVSSASFALTPSTVTGQTVSSVDLSSQANSQKALSILDAAIDTVTNSRANLGAYQNRFEAAISNLENTSTNLQASRSRILDTDYAKETTNLAKSQIVQQAATAMLAQANQSSQSVLALLK